MVLAQMPVVRSEADVSMLRARGSSKAVRRERCAHGKSDAPAAARRRQGRKGAPVAPRHRHAARGGRHGGKRAREAKAQGCSGGGPAAAARRRRRRREAFTTRAPACAPRRAAAIQGREGVAVLACQRARARASIRATRRQHTALDARLARACSDEAGRRRAQITQHTHKRSMRGHSAEQPSRGAGARQLVLLRRGTRLAPRGGALRRGAILGVAQAAHDVVRRVEHAPRDLLRAWRRA